MVMEIPAYPQGGALAALAACTAPITVRRWRRSLRKGSDGGFSLTAEPFWASTYLAAMWSGSFYRLGPEFNRLAAPTCLALLAAGRMAGDLSQEGLVDLIRDWGAPTEGTIIHTESVEVALVLARWSTFHFEVKTSMGPMPPERVAAARWVHSKWNEWAT